MANHLKDVAFQLKIANMIAALKFFSERGVLSYREHFDLWKRLLNIQTEERLNQFILEVQGIINKKKAKHLEEMNCLC